MNLSDEELMLLEQLTYLDEDMLKGAGFSKGEVNRLYNNCESVSDMVDILDDHVDELTNMGTIKGARDGSNQHCQGMEWAAVINEIKDNPELMNMNIQDTVIHESGEKKPRKIDNIVFYEGEKGNPQKDDPAILCFRGTLDAKEWEDNFELLDDGDTPLNQDSLKYVDGLVFDNITTVGHSKGGNKAAYAFYLSDKVNRCVAMDAPGFTSSFYEEHMPKIEKALQNGEISSYALDNDFVNIIFHELYGTDTKYCKGHGVKGFGENHSPNSFFHFCYETFAVETPNCYLYRDEHGNLLEYTEQGELMSKLHGFTLFIDKNMPTEQREPVAKFLGHLAAAELTSDYSFKDEESGKKYTKETINKYIMAHQDEASTVLAYLVVYANEYDLTWQDIKEVLPFWVEPMYRVFQMLSPLPYLADPNIFFEILKRAFAKGDIGVLLFLCEKAGADDLKIILENTCKKYNDIANKDGMGEVLYDYTSPSVSNSGQSIPAPSTNPNMPTVQFGDDNTNATEAASNNITMGKVGAPRSSKSAGSAMSNSMFATIDKDTMYVDVAEFERHRKDIYNAADKLIFNAKPAFEREAGICGTESVCLMTDYWHKVIDTTDKFREFKMGPADLLMRNTLKSLLDVDAESAETIKVQSEHG